MTVADVLADGLRRAGVARVFVADGADAPLVAALRTAGLPVVEVTHGASACVMAAVTGRLGDVPGVAVIGEDDPAVGRAASRAQRDAAPLIVVASRAPVTAPVKTLAVAGADSAAHWVAHAVQAAMAEPPGCVWLAAAPDVATRPALPLATSLRPAPALVDAAELETIVASLTAAARPLLVAGRGCRARSAAGWVRAFAEALPAPLIATAAGRGALPEPHPLSFGVLGADSPIVRRADLIVALGVDDAELDAAGVAFAAPLVRIRHVEVVLEELAPRLRDRARADWDVAELDRLRRTAAPAAAPLADLVTRLRGATPAETVAVFPEALAPASRGWQSVQPGDVLVEDDVLAASTAVALARPDGLVLAFGGASEDALAVAARAGVRVDAASPAALAPSIATALATPGPRVIVVPAPAAGGPSAGRV